MDNTFPTTQEAFDACVNLPATLEVMYDDFDKVITKHMDDLRTVGKTDEFYDDVLLIAERFGVEFTHPKYAKGLTAVKTRPTVH